MVLDGMLIGVSLEGRDLGGLGSLIELGLEIDTSSSNEMIVMVSLEGGSRRQTLESTLVQVVSHVIASEQRLEDSKKGIEELEKKLVGLQPDIRKLNDELAAGDGKIYCAGRRGKMLLQNGGSISSKFEQALQLLDLFNISS
ncbi:hypothetical protein LINPERPRIM_LOCUS4469 [Linum perenne]